MVAQQQEESRLLAVVVLLPGMVVFLHRTGLGTGGSTSSYFRRVDDDQWHWR